MATICPFFLRGTCRYGPQCHLSHDIVNASTPGAAFPPPVHTQSYQSSSNQVICKFFQQGRCTQGSACLFNHLDASGPTSPQAKTQSWRRPLATTQRDAPLARSAAQSDLQGAFPRDQCKYFLKGMCKNGDLCTFRHPRTPNTVKCSPPSHDPVTGSPFKTPCIYFNLGQCTKGEACTFLHVIESWKERSVQSTLAIKPDGRTAKHNISQDEGPKPAYLSQSSLSSEALVLNHAPEDQADVPVSTPSSTISTRSILHCEVHFGAGASVMQVTTPFESSNVILSNLPQSLTQADMLDLTRPLEGLVKFNVFEATSTATLQFASCDQAAKAVRYLDDRPCEKSKIAARLNLRGAVESGSGTLFSRRVKLSWFAPALMAWANYPSMAHARKVVDKLTEKTFNGRTLSASLRNSNVRSMRGSLAWSSSSSSTIKIKGLPLETDLAHLERFTQSNSVTLGEPTYLRNEGIEGLRQLLSKYGPLESFDILPVDNKKTKLTAFAQFSNSDAAAKAAKEVHNTKHEFLGNNIVWVEQIHSIKYSIPCGQFRIVKGELDHLQTGHDVSKLRYYDQEQGGVDPVCIRIYGSDPKKLGRLKVDLEQVLRGEAFMLDGKDVWDEYFETEDGKHFISEVNVQPTSFVKCDTRTRTLYLYGDRDHARRLIIQRLEEIVARRHVLLLRKEKLKALLTGGLKTLADEIGADKLVLDVIALTLTVRGDEEDLRKVRHAVAAMDNSAAAQLGESLEGLCPVCFCDPSNPIGLPCGHSYCSMCLQHLLRSHSQSANFTLVKCIAEVQTQADDPDIKAAPNSPCGAYVPYSTIRELLSPAEETMLFEASFLSHVHARTKEFQYCPTPDCRVVYRHNDEGDHGTVLQCPACLARICARCHVEFHEGLTCAQHIDNISGGLQALQQWKDANGVKACPTCTADLEKNGGCNHITCAACGTHMCWVCMKTFRSGQEVYDHMNRAHQSIGLDYPEIL